jgi:hypothetical protein
MSADAPGGGPSTPGTRPPTPEAPENSQQPPAPTGTSRFPEVFPHPRRWEQFWESDPHTKWGYHLVVVVFARNEHGIPCMATADYHMQDPGDLITGDYSPKVDAHIADGLSPQLMLIPPWLRSAMRHVAQKLHLCPSKLAWGKEALLCGVWRPQWYGTYQYRTHRHGKDIVVVPALYLDYCAQPDYSALTLEHLLSQRAQFAVPNNQKMYSTKARWAPYFGHAVTPIHRQCWALASVAVVYLQTHPPTTVREPTKMLPLVWAPWNSPLSVSPADVDAAMEALRIGGMRGTQVHDTYIKDARMCGPWVDVPLVWVVDGWRGAPTKRPAPPTQTPRALLAEPGAALHPPSSPPGQAPATEPAPAQDSPTLAAPPGLPPPPTQPAPTEESVPGWAQTPQAAAPDSPPALLQHEHTEAATSEQASTAPPAPPPSAVEEDLPKEGDQIPDPLSPSREPPQEALPRGPGGPTEEATAPPTTAMQDASAAQARGSPRGPVELAAPAAWAQDPAQIRQAAPDSPGDQVESPTFNASTLESLD